MNSFDLMRAIGGAPSEFVEEALSDPAEDLPAADIAEPEIRITAQEEPHRPLLTILSAAACAAVVFGLGAVIWKLNRPGIPSEISAFASQTEPAVPRETDQTPSGAVSGTDISQSDGAVSTHTTTTVSAITVQGSLSAGETVTTGMTVTTFDNPPQTSKTVTTATQTAASRTTDKTTAPIPTSTTATTATAPAEADPEAVIRQLQTGMMPGFAWDVVRHLRNGQTVSGEACEIDHYPYGVAFLCRDSDLEALKTDQIGYSPVQWKEGFWPDMFTGRTITGQGVGLLAENGQPICFVQTVEAFRARYGSPDALYAEQTFSVRYEQQTEFAIVNDYADKKRPGWTVCMATAAAPLSHSESGTVYLDWSSLIRAIAARDDLVLLGTVYGEERSFGEPSFHEWSVLFAHGDVPDPADFAAYGTLSFGAGNDAPVYDWATLELSEARVQALMQQNDSDRTRQMAEQLAAELEALPGVRFVKPMMIYPDQNEK